MNAPCPICRAPYGFHDDAPHEAAVAAIPAHLRLPTSSALRADSKTARRAAYEAYLAKGVGK